MNQLTPRSKKEEIWAEKERLENEAREGRRRIAVLEKELEQARRELERARERGAFAERLKDELRASSEKLALLTRLTADLASFDLDGVLKACVERIPYLVGARRASLYLHDGVKKLLTLKQHTHERSIDPLVDLVRTPASLMAQAVRTKQLLLIEDLADYRRDDGQAPERPHKERYRTRSCMVCPLVAGGEVLGVMNLTDRFDERPFDKADQELVKQACDLLAVSLRNARLFDEVQNASRTDSLTGLLNHRATVERLDVESKRARRYGHDLAIVLVDIDRLSLVNANHGHGAGDAVLEQTGKLVRGNVRDVDICGRTGGDEFCVILPEQNLKGALVVAERLARIFKDQRFRVGDDALLEVPATVGVVQVSAQESASEALVRAKEAIGQARRDGRAVFVKG